MAIGADSETIIARMLRSPADAHSIAVAGGLAPAADIAALTDNSGGATADKTIGAVTAPTALTDSGGGTADGTVAAMADIATAGGATPTAAQVDTAVNAVLLNIRNNFKEVTTTQTANRTAIVALTDAVKELSTQINLLRTNMRSAGQML